MQLKNSIFALKRGSYKALRLLPVYFGLLTLKNCLCRSVRRSAEEFTETVLTKQAWAVSTQLCFGVIPGQPYFTLLWGDHPHLGAVLCNAGCPVLRAWTWAITQGCRAQWGDTGLLGGTTLSEALQTPSVTSYVPPLSRNQMPLPSHQKK